MKKQILITALASMLLLAACSESHDYDYGYKDGYEAGQEEYEIDYNDLDMDNFDKGTLIEYLEDNGYLVYDKSMTYEMADYLTEHGFVVLDEDEANEYNLNDMLNSTTYIGNAGSMKFHKATCSSVMDINEENKVYNDSYDYFIENGYEPCKKCNP